MENKPEFTMRYKAFVAMLSAATGLAGLAILGRCSGGSCTSCYGCAAPGAGILVLGIVNALAKGRAIRE